ncbi:hypothetical protein GQ651_08065 [Alphaproteobacteria bacterium GH1-50]|uniref:Uncharacterized protein n=1 Tax=Kangsaoukella pontilimi TaxID=2691042 RepID=A0A7C9MVP0_9RHOB|nr:hypothetical protein [Kangsaoukella pontilimi]MXQ07800.1 hypothetical protein [Kangsaoukella pontilimi]
MAMIDAGMARRETDIPGMIGRFFKWLAPEVPSTPETAEECRARRALLTDMLDRNGDAFQSEADIQCMMSVYPGRF